MRDRDETELARMGRGHGFRHGRPQRRGARRLSEMEAGSKGQIAHVCCRGHIGKRLLEMGLTRGTPIEVVRHAPLGDPVEIRVRGYLLSLRQSEAERIEVDS